MKRFKKAYIEITNVCNLNCIFCPKTKREKEYITPDNFRYVMRDIKKYVNFIYLHLMGEPLVHPKLDELLDIADEEKMKVNITSNGTLIDKVKDIIVKHDSVRKVSFSVHSFEGNQFDSYNKENNDINKDGTNEITPSLKKYLDNIIDFSKHFASLEKTVVLKLWNLDSNNKDVIDKKGKNNLNEMILNYIYDNLKKSEEDNQDAKSEFRKSLLVTGNMKISNHIFIQLGERFEWPITSNYENESGKIFCYGSVDQFGVLVNGDVTACCLDSEGEIKLGNIYKDGMTNIIEGEKFIKFNELMKGGIAPRSLCKRCSYARGKVEK